MEGREETNRGTAKWRSKRWKKEKGRGGRRKNYKGDEKMNKGNQRRVKGLSKQESGKASISAGGGMKIFDT